MEPFCKVLPKGLIPSLGEFLYCFFFIILAVNANSINVRQKFIFFIVFFIFHPRVVCVYKSINVVSYILF